MENSFLFFYIKACFLIVFCSYSLSVHAELPLTVGDLMADKNKFVLDTSLLYHNKNNSTENSDTIVPTIGIRYGISDMFSVGIKSSGIFNNQRYKNSTKNITDYRLQNILVTAQYQLFHNHAVLPDSLVFVEVSAYDNSKNITPKAFSSALIGATAYKAYDPVVLSLTGAYVKNRGYEGIQDKISIGDSLVINSLVSFAVNPDISLAGGVGWQLNKPSSQNGIIINNAQTQTYLDFGLSYAINQRSSLAANVRTNITREGNSTLLVGLTTKIGDLPAPLSEKYRSKQAQKLF